MTDKIDILVYQRNLLSVQLRDIHLDPDLDQEEKQKRTSEIQQQIKDIDQQIYSIN